jgi:FkbM family methyltransferase
MKSSEILRQSYNIDFNGFNILECGAGAAQETNDFCNTNNCYYIEANYPEYEELKRLNYNVFHYALSNSNDNITFTVSSHGGNSSVSHSELHKQELIHCYNSTFTEVVVPGITYKTFIQDVIKTNIDILILDVEGHECTILNTFFELDVSQLPKIICIECGYDWIERKHILLKLGYNLDFYEFNNCYLSHSNYHCIKNISQINNFNQNNKNFIWNNHLVYENELIL